MSVAISHKYKFAALAVDVVVLTIRDNALCALLIKNDREPFKDCWTLPGGLVNENETLEDAVERVLDNKVHLKNAYCEQVYTFGDLNRDPRSRVVSVAYMTLIPSDQVTPQQDQDLQWKQVDHLPELAYDHNLILAKAVERLKSKMEYSTIVYSLLPKEFVFSQLQHIYEIILGRPVDKRNFRRKLLSLHIIEELPKQKKGRPNRPASLFRFTNSEPEIVEIL